MIITGGSSHLVSDDGEGVGVSGSIDGGEG